MNRVLGLARVAERAERLAEQRLQVHLPRVDHVVDPRRVAEGGRVTRRRSPTSSTRATRPPACVGEAAIQEVAAEQAELPELVGDVFADVGDDAVRSHDDFFSRISTLRPSLARLAARRRRRRRFAAFLDAHDPAAGQASFGLQKHGALRLQNLERVRPELQPEDVAFEGEQVVADIQPLHRRQMRADDAIDDERADRGGVVAAACSRSCSAAARIASRSLSPAYHSVTRE